MVPPILDPASSKIEPKVLIAAKMANVANAGKTVDRREILAGLRGGALPSWGAMRHGAVRGRIWPERAYGVEQPARPRRPHNESTQVPFDHPLCGSSPYSSRYTGIPSRLYTAMAGIILEIRENNPCTMKFFGAAGGIVG